MLELKKISFSAENNGKKIDILKDITISFPNTKIITITGPNGSGKSTLAKIIMGILQPTHGQIIFNGVDITKYSITERANLGISYAFQQPITFKGLTVKDLLNVANAQNNTLHDACSYLSQVGLCAKDYINRNLDNKLSGGELKRVELATLLARNTTFNIFDEPEAGIDLWSFEDLINIFKNTKATNIIISHQQKIIEIADAIVLLKAGKIEKVGSYAEIKPYLEHSTCNKLKGANNE